MKYLLVIFSIVIFGSLSCNNKSADDQMATKLQNDDSSIIFQTETLIEKYDTTRFNSKTMVLYNPNETIVECLYEKQQPKILHLNTISNEDGMRDTFAEVFYFGENGGFPIVYSYKVNQEISRQVITRDRNVISYLMKDGKVTYINKLDSFTKETKISAVTFILAVNIIHFDGLDYQMPKTTLNSMPVILTLKDSIKLYKNPDTNSLGLRALNEGEHLFYIGYSKDTTPWLNIATEDKKYIGWIISDSANIQYYTDGD